MPVVGSVLMKYNANITDFAHFFVIVNDDCDKISWFCLSNKAVMDNVNANGNTCNRLSLSEFNLCYRIIHLLIFILRIEVIRMLSND